jgi:hypothetical protein
MLLDHGSILCMDPPSHRFRLPTLRNMSIEPHSYILLPIAYQPTTTEQARAVLQVNCGSERLELELKGQGKNTMY